MLELVQGEGGVNPSDPQYVKDVRKWCDEKGLLFILDEVQTGIGRLGPSTAMNSTMSSPILCVLPRAWAAVSPSAPFSATTKPTFLSRATTAATYCGNPLTCAASYAVVKYITDNDIPKHVREISAYFWKELEGLKAKYPGLIYEIRGKGLLIGVGLTKDVAGPL